MVEADCQNVDAWSPKDPSLDSFTFEAYLASRGADKIALATAAVWTRAMLGQDPCDISALFFLNYCKSGGGLLTMRSDRKGGGQHLRVRQGTQLFAKGLASDLPKGTISLSSPVQNITQRGRQQADLLAGGVLYSARKVISTVPSPVLKTISFNPPLPQEKIAWLTSSGYGYYCKAMMQFSTPFWIEKGFCGLAQSFIGPASVVRDTSSPTDEKHILTCFMAGDSGKAWSTLPQQEREQALLKQLQALFSISDLQRSFVKSYSHEWNDDEYAGWGCPSISLTPGVLGGVGADAFRQSWKNVHFAGTETAGEWKGYMEGAVRSGERAALEVVKDLTSGVVARL